MDSDCYFSPTELFEPIKILSLNKYVAVVSYVSFGGYNSLGVAMPHVDSILSRANNDVFRTVSASILVYVAVHRVNANLKAVDSKKSYSPSSKVEHKDQSFVAI